MALDSTNSPYHQYETLVRYLKLKVEQGDWHGVADAAMDIRELLAKHNLTSEEASGRAQ